MPPTRLLALVTWLRPEPMIAVLIWGGIFTAGKYALAEIPFLSFTLARLLISGLVLLAIAGRPGLAVPFHSWRDLLLAGLLQATFQTLLCLSLLLISAATSAVLFATSPILLTLGLWLVTRRRPPTTRLAGLALGIVGVALVVQPGRPDVSPETILGGLLAVASAGCWGWYAVAVRPLVVHAGSVLATAWALTAAALLLAPFAAGELLALDLRLVSPVAWGGLFYNALLGGVVAMTLWGRAVHRLGAEQTMTYTYVESVAAVVIAALLLGERLGPLELLGGLMIFVALWLSR